MYPFFDRENKFHWRRTRHRTSKELICWKVEFGYEMQPEYSYPISSWGGCFSECTLSSTDYHSYHLCPCRLRFRSCKPLQCGTPFRTFLRCLHDVRKPGAADHIWSRESCRCLNDATSDATDLKMRTHAYWLLHQKLDQQNDPELFSIWWNAALSTLTVSLVSGLRYYLFLTNSRLLRSI